MRNPSCIAVLLLLLLALPATAAATHFRYVTFNWERTSPQTLTAADPITGWLEIGGIGPDGIDGVRLLPSDPDDSDAGEGGTRQGIGPIRWMAPESMRDRQYSRVAHSISFDVWQQGVRSPATIGYDWLALETSAYQARAIQGEWNDVVDEAVALLADNPVWLDQGIQTTNPLAESVDLPESLLVELEPVDGDDSSSKALARAGVTSPVSVITFHYYWGEPVSLDVFDASGARVPILADELRFRVFSSTDEAIERLRELRMNWAVEDGMPGAVRIRSAAIGAFGHAWTGLGESSTECVIDPATARQVLRIDTSLGDGGVSTQEDLVRVKAKFPWLAGDRGTVGSGAVDFVIETLGVDGLPHSTTSRTTGEGVDTIVDFLVDGLPALASWHYELDGETVHISDHPPDPGLGATPSETSLALEELGALHVHEMHFDSPVDVIPEPGGPSILVDMIRVRANVGVVSLPASMATIRINATALDSGALQILGMSSSRAASTNPGIMLQSLGGADLSEIGRGAHLLENVGLRLAGERAVFRQDFGPVQSGRIRIEFPPEPIRILVDPAVIEIRPKAVATGGGVTVGNPPALEVIGHEGAHVVQSKTASGGGRRVPSTVNFLRYEFGQLVETATVGHGEGYAFDFDGQVDEAGVQLSASPGGFHRVWFTMAPIGALPRGDFEAVDGPLLLSATAPLYLEMRVAADPGEELDLTGITIGASGVLWMVVGEASLVQSVDVPRTDVGRSLAMDSAAPNPFNPRTSIVLEAARATDATLRVYDLRGQLVDVIFEGRLPAGRSPFVWEGADHRGRAVASGTYLLRLDGAGTTGVATQKVVLVR